MKYLSFSIVFTILSFCANAQVPSYVDTNGLLAWYPFDGSLNNVYNGPVNDGIGHGTITFDTDRAGVANHCYTGNGLNGIDIPSNNFPTGNAARSVSVYFKSAYPYPGGQRQLIAWGNNTATGQEFGILVSDTTIAFEYNGGSVYKRKTPDNLWHNVTVTYPSSGSGSSSLKLYFDGVLSTTTIQAPIAALSTDTGSIHCIGTLSYATNQNSWSGKIDDIGIWNRELTSCEVQRLFSGPDTLHVTLDSVPDMCKAHTGFLKANVTGGIPPYRYLWSAPTAHSISPNSIDSLPSGVYSVTVTDTAGCIVHAAATITDNCMPIMIAEGMSPNGDGLNDYWETSGLEHYPLNTVQVYDKWGNLVYEQGNYQNDWGGKGKDGALLPDGTYRYLVKLNGPELTGRPNVYTGLLMLRR